MNIMYFILLQLFLHGLVYYCMYVVGRLEKARIECNLYRNLLFLACFIILLFHIVIFFEYSNSVLFDVNLIGMWS
ncbi:hypothetical protein ACQH7H_24370, partial [Escherichia coli]|uniref:hypothetical protein n=1 Tax=Escherichia coli TaxID=562 RepID=UPI003CF99986